MLFLIFFLMFTRIRNGWGLSTGSAIFYNRYAHEGCWNEEDIAKLQARRLFEKLIPLPVSPERVNGKYIRDTLRYFREALHTVDNDVDKHTAVMLKAALADTIGAHLRSEILPTARFAYYAGYVPYAKVRELHDFYDNIKIILNTRGLGWKKPESVPEWSNLTVAKILIGNGKYFDPCGCLILKRDSSACMHVPLPRLDDERSPAALALPLRTGGLVSLTSPVSDNILLKYYTTVSRCILNSSPAACRHTDFVNFNNDMWHWMKRNVAPHLVDEHLYAAYGGVLRIAAAVQSYGKGLSRRNLFDVQSAGASKWHPWKTLADSYVYINTDWTPHLYVGVVLLAAVLICLVQMCFNFVLGDQDGCTCRERPAPSLSKDAACAAVESNVPPTLPAHRSAVFYAERRRASRARSGPRTTSLRSFETQKVYDLNENIEKYMAVIMSDKENISEGVESVTSGRGGKGESGRVSDESRSERSAGPPEIQPDIAEVQISKCCHERSRLPLCSTSTAARSETTRRAPATDSNWSGSTSSDRSASSTTSKSRGVRSREPRDLGWARRLLSKHTQRKSTSGTELDYTSFTTPPSKR